MSNMPDDLVFYGTVEPTSVYAVTLPVRARRELGLETRNPVFVFGSPSQKQLILTAGPASAPALLALISREQL